EGFPEGIEPPVERRCVLHADERFFGERKRACARKQGEVALLILRPGGKLLLHTKRFYPPGIFRIPTGSIELGERVWDALWREMREETGLKADLLRFLAVVTTAVEWNGRTVLWPS